MIDELLDKYGFSRELVEFIHKKTGIDIDVIVNILKTEREYYLYLLSGDG